MSERIKLRPDPSIRPTERDLPAIDPDLLNEVILVLAGALQHLQPGNAVGEEVQMRIRKLLRRLTP